MNLLSNKNRSQNKQVLEQEYDLIVVGGGITGAGIALDASTRGLKVAVIEMQDFAAGTSSRSTKLIHGGLRYLKNFEIKLVSEVGKEREVVYENGPHVTTPEWMMLPFYEKGSFGPFSTSIGLRVYDYLAGVKKMERRRMLSVEETLEREPLLNREGLKGSGFYVEYKTDDARLTLEVLKKAVDLGANAFNYMRADQFTYRDGKLTGVQVTDLMDDQEHTLKARSIINATGPWVDDIRSKDHTKMEKHLFLTKGVHLVFDQSIFPLKQAVYFDTPDERMVFAIPRDGKTYIGTTDTHYEGDIANPTTTLDDRTYLMGAIHEMFPNVHVTDADIESTWAGLRPLVHEEGKDPSEISRKDEIFESDSGLISVAGGKLTGYRKMAEELVDLVLKRTNIEKDFPKSNTKKIPISGGDVGGSKGFQTFARIAREEGLNRGIPENLIHKWIQRYGSNVNKVFDFYDEVDYFPNHKREVYAELMYGLEYELVAGVNDFFNRRTGALYFDIEWVEKNREDVLKLMKEYFDWATDRTDNEREKLDQAIKEAKEPSQHS